MTPSATLSAVDDPSAYPAHVTDPTNYAWRERHWRRPTVPADEAVVFEEPGRVLKREGERNGVCCRSHYFVVTKPSYGQPQLRVKHGGGEQALALGYDQHVLEGLERLTSDERFRFFWLLLDTHREGYTRGSGKVSAEYEAAFLEGRLRKRKKRGTNAVRVEIKPRPLAPPTPVGQANVPSA